jgi:hypothetical protein
MYERRKPSGAGPLSSRAMKGPSPSPGRQLSYWTESLCECKNLPRTAWRRTKKDARWPIGVPRAEWRGFGLRVGQPRALVELGLPGMVPPLTKKFGKIISWRPNRRPSGQPVSYTGRKRPRTLRGNARSRSWLSEPSHSRAPTNHKRVVMYGRVPQVLRDRYRRLERTGLI